MEDKKTNGNLALNGREYRVIKIEANDERNAQKLRVAAYCRVSSSSEDQLNSFMAQNVHYTQYISAHENWRLVDIYADEGITGTSIEKREDFKRMLADSQRGLIDRILVKSISRFARNTSECLEAIRQLKVNGTTVYFEKEGIDTSRVTSELMTTLHAAFSQNESESISGNMRWSYQKRMERGEFNTYQAPIGYRLINGNLVIQEEEAIIIYDIFQKYLDGYNSRDIAKHLNKNHVLGIRWDSQRIDYILKNERYAGNCLLQKSFTTASFPHQQKRNRGECPQYYHQDSHNAIVPQVLFDKAQRLRQSRKLYQVENNRDFAGTLVCRCGASLRCKCVNAIWYWICRRHDEDKSACPITQIPETQIQQAFLRLYYNLKHQGSGILPGLIDRLQSIQERRFLWNEDVIALNQKIADITSQNQLLATLKRSGCVDPDIFIAKSNELAEQLRAAKQAKHRIMNKAGNNTVSRTKELIAILSSGPDMLDIFDAELFSQLIDKIIIDSNTSLRFRLKNGLELRETMERTVR